MAAAALLCSALADADVKLELPAGNYQAFASHGPAETVPTNPIASKGGELELATRPGDDHVYVVNLDAGDLAEQSGTALKSPWTLKPENFDRIALITVATEHDGKPLVRGDVSIGDGDPRHAGIIDPSKPATFFDVKPGDVAIVVKVPDKQGQTQTVLQIFKEPIDRKDAWPKLTVAVAQDVETAGPSSTSPAASPQSLAPGPRLPAPKPRANPFGVLVGWVLALAIAAGVIYLVIVYFRQNAGTVAAKLEQLGVQIPKPQDDALTSPAPVAATPIRPPAPEKIVLSDAAPMPLADPAPVMTSTAVAMPLGEPSLVSDSGVPIPLVEGETLVGRDIGLGLSLSAETTVSRRHAQIARTGTEVTVSDLGSTNGTFVNGVRLESITPLRPGDTVQFGSVRFRFQV